MANHENEFHSPQDNSNLKILNRETVAQTPIRTTNAPVDTIKSNDTSNCFKCHKKDI